MSKKLQGMTAVVTGAGSGIGRSIAVVLAEEGCNIAAVDLNGQGAEETVKSISQTGQKAISIQADVSSSSEVDEALKQILQRWGSIHILVNNAGIATPPVSVLKLEETMWRRALDVNLTSQFIWTQRVATEMVRHKIKGRIVNISSGVLNKLVRYRTAYCTSKIAVAYFTKAAALDLAEHGIRINAIAPGMIITPMTDKYRTAPGDDADYMRAWTSAIPAGRWGEPREVARAVLFLVSDDAGYINGSVLTVDGGFTIT